MVVESATLPGERVLPTRLSGLARTCARLGDGPALVMIGEVYESIVLQSESEAERRFA